MATLTKTLVVGDTVRISGHGPLLYFYGPTHNRRCAEDGVVKKIISDYLHKTGVITKDQEDGWFKVQFDNGDWYIFHERELTRV